MNRLAISYAFNCSHVRDGEELINTYAFAFLVAIAYRIPSRSRYETEPTTLAELEGMTRMSNRQLRAIRDLLVLVGEIREGGEDAPDHADPENERSWAKHAIYQLPGLAGPLFIVTPWDTDLNAAQLAALRAQKSARGAAKSARRAAFQGQNAAHGAAQSRHSVPSSANLAGGVLLSKAIPRGTNYHHHDDDDAQTPPIVSAALQVVADDLFDWIVTEYPTHNAGALFSMARESAVPILIRLLETGRTLDKLQAMAVKLWTCTERDHHWIATKTDRSLYILWKERDALDQLVSRPGRRRPGEAPDYTRLAAPYDAAAARAEALQRAIRMLRRAHPIAALNDARQRAADALEAPGADVATIEANIIDLAAAHMDMAALRKEAEKELESFRARMPADAFERTVATCAQRLLREHAQLPILRDLVPLSAQEETLA